MPRGDEVIVRVSDLRFSYENPPGRLVLDGVNLSFRRGRFYLVAGASGSGKSTLLKCIVGLIPHMYPGFYSGEVVVAGYRVRETPVRTLARHVGFVFQNPENQIFMFNVGRDVAFGLENLGFDVEEIRGRVGWAVKALGIEGLVDKQPHELSDGQKQRVALAGVLALKPEVLILDEPTSLLDPRTAYEVIKVVDELRRALGITVIVVEHRLEILLPMVDEVVVLKSGRVVAVGDPRDVFSDPGLVKLIREAQVSIPPVVEVYHRLLSSGVRLGRLPLSTAELLEEVNKYRLRVAR